MIEEHAIGSIMVIKAVIDAKKNSLMLLQDDHVFLP